MWVIAIAALNIVSVEQVLENERRLPRWSGSPTSVCSQQALVDEIVGAAAMREW
jgi:hypothetical protein